MRATFFYTVIGAQLLGLVAAQSADTSSLPSCALTCLGQADVGKCSAFDSKCLCTSKSFMTSVLSCAQKSCKDGDVVAAENMVKNICQPVGVSVSVPAPSSVSKASSASSMSANPSSASSAPSTKPSVPALQLPECGNTCVRLMSANGRSTSCKGPELSQIFTCLSKGCQAKEMADSISAIATHCAVERNPSLASVMSFPSSSAMSSSASAASSSASAASSSASSARSSSSAVPSTSAPVSSAKPSSGSPSSTSGSSAKPSSSGAPAPKPTAASPAAKDTPPTKSSSSASQSPTQGNAAPQGASPGSVAGLMTMFVGMLAFCVYL